MADGNILIERNKRSVRVYQKGAMIFMLCDFLPIESGFMQALEELGLHLMEVNDYPETSMGVVIVKGVLDKTLSIICESEVL